MSNKCFCHLNGLAVKDATARNMIENLQKLKTVTGGTIKFFVGTQAEYDALTDAQKQDLFALITDDTTHADLLKQLEDITNINNEASDKFETIAQTLVNHGENIAELYASADDLTEADKSFGKFDGVWTDFKTGNYIVPGTYQIIVSLTDGGRTLNTSYLVYFNADKNMSWSMECGEKNDGINTYPIDDYIYRLRIWASGDISVHRSKKDGSIPWATLTNGVEWTAKYRKIHS